MTLLEKIRNEIKANVDSSYYGGMEETADMLMELWYDNKAESVFSNTEDRGGRWTKWEIKVFKVTVDGDTAYFRIEKEVGATENQSDGDTVVREVMPKEKIVIEYVQIN